LPAEATRLAKIAVAVVLTVSNACPKLAAKAIATGVRGGAAAIANTTGSRKCAGHVAGAISVAPAIDGIKGSAGVGRNRRGVWCAPLACVDDDGAATITGVSVSPSGIGASCARGRVCGVRGAALATRGEYEKRRN